MKTQNGKGSMSSLKPTGEDAACIYLKARRRMREILAHAKAGDAPSRAFNTLIVGLILLNVVAMVIESVDRIYSLVPTWFTAFEYFSVVVFSVEYILRIWSCKAMAAMTAVFGIGMFALPTAILGAGFLDDLASRKKAQRCPHCGKEIPS